MTALVVAIAGMIFPAMAIDKRVISTVTLLTDVIISYKQLTFNIKSTFAFNLEYGGAQVTGSSNKVHRIIIVLVKDKNVGGFVLFGIKQSRRKSRQTAV
jgi:altronate dehydratase